MKNITDFLVNFFNTFDLDQLLTFFNTFDPITFFSNGGVLAFIVIVTALLFSPVKSVTATFLVYGLLAIGLVILVILLKNSEFSSEESFIIYGGGFVGITGFFIYTNMIRG